MAMKKWTVVAAMLCVPAQIAAAQDGEPEKPIAPKVDWANTQPLRTTPTLQVVLNPLLRRGSPIHDATFATLQQLGAEVVRYAVWHPYPKLAVAELDPPTPQKTS